MSNPAKRVIALGVFDGVHLGHAALLRRTVEEAARRGCTPAVFTFDRPPKEVVTGVPCPLINSPEDRRDIMYRLYGIKDIIMAPFDREMMTTSWEDFVTELLVDRWHAVHLVAGHDHRFGHKNQGTPELLLEKCNQLGLGCDIIPKVEIGGVTISSTYIRRLIELGQVERAARFLGHPHTLTGIIRHGRALGPSRLGSTADLTIPPHVLTPACGVYIARIFFSNGESRPAVAAVGIQPAGITVQTCIPDFEGELYGQTLRVEFYRRLWDQISLDFPDNLWPELVSNMEISREYFQTTPSL